MLAKRGFAVFAYDCFLWGSRRFPEDGIPGRLREILEADDYERLAVMHEAIYGTTPWTRPEGKTSAGDKIRFTCRGEDLFAIFAKTPAQDEVTILDLVLPEAATVLLVACRVAALTATRQGRNLVVTLPPLAGSMPLAPCPAARQLAAEHLVPRLILMTVINLGLSIGIAWTAPRTSRKVEARRGFGSRWLPSTQGWKRDDRKGKDPGDGEGREA